MVCAEDMCTGCMACLERCTATAITIVDNLKAYNASIDNEKCIHCNQCQRVCQVNYPLRKQAPILWKQGWAFEDGIRINSSSGGFATALMYCFLSGGGIVYSCSFQSGEFIYKRCDSIEGIEEFRGSKYVKSNPVGIYNTIKNDVENGLKVLFIGLPCHVAGLKKILNKDYDNLYTVDLICHGTPSPKIFGKFLEEKKIDIKLVKSVSFRDKGAFFVATDGKGITEKGAQDRYTIGFLKGLFYTQNCYECIYASVERVSDITIGDSWGTDLKTEMSRGVSIALCMTPKGVWLLEHANICLKDVDLDNAVQANHQLREPSKKIEARETFFQNYNKSKSVSKAVIKALPRESRKQAIKNQLIRFKLLRAD